jgi:predicted enzyme related to lactoylglutathione lyase
VRAEGEGRRVKEHVRGIGGVFFRSERPDELAQWYAEHLGVDLDHDFSGKTFVAADGDQTVWALFPADTTYFGPGGKQLMVNYRVRDVDAILAQLCEAGVQVDDRVEDTKFGRFGWATDPDGDRFELWEPPR